jgi:hypothetical protein
MPIYLRALSTCTAALLWACLSSAAAQERSPGRPEQILDATMHHLGDDSTPEWPEAPAEPEGTSLSFEFEASAVHGPWTLAYSQRHVSNNWRIEINGKLVTALRRSDERLDEYAAIPAGILNEGTNRFELLTDSPADDITFGLIRLIPKSFRDALNLVPVTLAVRNLKTKNPIPARFTILDEAGNKAKLYFADLDTQATREGVVYTHNGSVYFEVPAGAYQVTASRGSEWSIDTIELVFTKPDLPEFGGLLPANAIFSLDREVDTRGYVACDTHIHTLTFSGHGDSSVEERMVTLAGEGVELAIATDHNHNTDYEPTQKKMGLLEYFTSVVGNEVTTPIGHFNGFPLKPDEEIPPHDLHDMVQIVEGMRSRGAKVVILNHPRWPAHDTGPFGKFELDHFTGHSHATPHDHYPFDAMELVNSCTEETDPMLLFKDWFALLNRGEKVVAVGSSDSHTVGNPVGGGRTYVPSGAAPGYIDVDDAADAIAKGRTSIAMGIFVTASARRYMDSKVVGMGGELLAPGDSCEVTLHVRSPSWIKPLKAELFANGELIKRFNLDDHPENTFMNKEFNFRLENRPYTQDAWLVWVVTGDGVEGAHWPLHNDYTLGATNPIYVDWSNDGVYQSPRASALWMAETVGAERAVNADSWKSVTFHALENLREKLKQQALEKLKKFAEEARLDAAKVEEFLDRAHDH